MQARRSNVDLASVLVCLLIAAVASSPARSQAQEPDDPPQFSDWSDPSNLGAELNSASSDLTPVISKDELVLYFASNRPGGSGGIDLWVAQRGSPDQAWGTPTNLGAIINTGVTDNSPALSPDEHQMFFFSNRPGGFGQNDIYVSRRQDRRDAFGWRPAVNVGSSVNTSANERGPEYFEDPETGIGTLFFNSDRAGGAGGNDIYASTVQPDGTFGPAVLVPELSSPADDQALAIRRDGLELLLASSRAGTLGELDLWVSTRASTPDPWSAPVHLGPVLNSPADEAGVALSFDGTTLYLHSGRPGGFGGLDLYISTRTRITQPDSDL